MTNALRLGVFWGEIPLEDSNRQLELFDQRKEKGHSYFPDVDRVALFQRLSAHTPELGCHTPDIMHVDCAAQLAPVFL